MSNKAKIAVIGSYAVGMTIVCGHFPVAGETVSGSQFQAMHGGKGANQAVAAKRLGADVVYGGCVGQDSFGKMCFELMQQEEIDTKYVKRSASGMPTGVGLIYVNQEGENEIVIDLAANKELCPKDIDKMTPALKKCSILLMQLEISLETVVYAAKKCRENGIIFVLNPAPFQILPKELLLNCDYLTPNQTEARLILGLESDAKVTDEEVALEIQKCGVKNVVMTLGSKGVLIVNKEGMRKTEGIAVEVLDTTGAGDTFSAGLCVAMAEGKSLEEAVRFANTAAGLAVTKYGVINAIPNRIEVETFQKSKKES